MSKICGRFVRYLTHRKYPSSSGGEGMREARLWGLRRRWGARLRGWGAGARQRGVWGKPSPEKNAAKRDTPHPCTEYSQDPTKTAATCSFMLQLCWKLIGFGHLSSEARVTSIGGGLVIFFKKNFYAFPFFDAFPYFFWRLPLVFGHFKFVLALSQQPDHLGGWFWWQDDRIITYWGRNVNFRNVSHQLMFLGVKLV
jgi:hypothetical protein